MGRAKPAIGVCSAILVCGCASLPERPSQDGISVAEIVTAVQCELANVYRASGHAKLFDEYTAGVELHLKVTNDLQGSASASWTVPISANTLTASVGPSFGDTSFRDASLKFNVPMGNLKKDVRRDGTLNEKCQRGMTGLPQASTTLGLGDWLVDTANAVSENGVADMTSSGYLVDFIVVRGANGSIGFKTSRVNAIASLTPKNTVENNLNVGMLHNPAPTALPAAAKASSRRVSPEIQRQLDDLLQRQRLNSIISPNSVILPN